MLICAATSPTNVAGRYVALFLQAQSYAGKSSRSSAIVSSSCSSLHHHVFVDGEQLPEASREACGRFGVDGGFGRTVRNEELGANLIRMLFRKSGTSSVV